ncbi:hypothetical protein [Acinetobacter sp. ANC 3832]|uniref:hypothetical protein n=1 Tax=Acinetobacter sp. ANC 3832 TaxID=1977874 RepID=UPI000A354825|nr:hypothetical protein [Acinetobacter sp. ANC 3832]OTG91134.1 hypothetical protein B9T35_14460 [Acinetobacter sp. ANC 3832]
MAKSATISSGLAGGMDVGMQMLECQCADYNRWNWKRTGGVAAVSGVVGAWGAGTSYAAGFGQVGWLGIARNSPNTGQFIKNNASGLVVWGHEQVFGQLGSRAVKATTDSKENKSETDSKEKK